MNISNKIFGVLAIAMAMAFIAGEADAHRRRDCSSSEENTTESYTSRWSGQVKNCTCLKVDGEDDRYTWNCGGSSNSTVRRGQWRGGHHGRKHCSSAQENETYTSRRSGLTKICICQQDAENNRRWNWNCDTDTANQQGDITSANDATTTLESPTVD